MTNQKTPKLKPKHYISKRHSTNFNLCKNIFTKAKHNFPKNVVLEECFKI